MNRISRVWRWCKRNKATAISLTALFASLSFGAFTATYFAIRAEHNADETQLALNKLQERYYSSAVQAAENLRQHDPAQSLAILGSEIECPTRLRDFAWQYVHARAQASTLRFQAHAQSVHGMCLSNDGKLLVTYSTREVKSWDPQTLTKIAEWTCEEGISGIVLTDTTSTVICRDSRGRVSRWNAQTGRSLSSLKAPESNSWSSSSLSTSPICANAKYVAAFGSSQNSILIWKSTDGEFVRKLDLEHPPPSGLFFTPSESLLAVFSAFGRTLQIYDIDTGTLKNKSAISMDMMDRIALAPNREAIAFGTSRGLNLLHWSQEKQIYNVSSTNNPSLLSRNLGDREYVSSFGTNLWLDGKSIAVQDSATVKLRDIKSAKLLGAIATANTSATCVIWSSDGSTVYYGCSDGTVGVATDSLPAYPIALVSGNSMERPATFFPKGDRLLTGDGLGTLRIWRVDTGAIAATFNTWMRALKSVVFSHNGASFATLQDSEKKDESVLSIWATDPVRQTHSVKLRECMAEPVFAADDSYVAVGCGNAIKLLEIDGLKTRRQISLESPVTALAFSGNGSILVAGDNRGSLTLWKCDSWTQQFKFQPHSQEITSVAFLSNDSEMLTASKDATLKHLSTEGTTLATLRGHIGPIKRMLLRPDRRTAVSESEDTTIFWDVLTGSQRLNMGTERLTLPPSDDAFPFAVAYQSAIHLWPDGQFLEKANIATEKLKVADLANSSETWEEFLKRLNESQSTTNLSQATDESYWRSYWNRVQTTKALRLVEKLDDRMLSRDEVESELRRGGNPELSRRAVEIANERPMDWARLIDVAWRNVFSAGTTKEQLRRSIKLCESALNDKFADARVRPILATAHFRVGDFEKVHQTLRDAKYDDEYAPINDVLRAAANMKLNNDEASLRDLYKSRWKFAQLSRRTSGNDEEPIVLETGVPLLDRLEAGLHRATPAPNLHWQTNYYSAIAHETHGSTVKNVVIALGSPEWKDAIKEKPIRTETTDRINFHWSKLPATYWNGSGAPEGIFGTVSTSKANLDAGKYLISISVAGQAQAWIDDRLIAEGAGYYLSHTSAVTDCSAGEHQLRIEHRGNISRSALVASFRYLGPQNTDRLTNDVKPSITELRARIGKSAVVEFRVGCTGESGRVRFLNSMINFRDPMCFTVVFPSDRANDFEKMGFKDWKNSLIGHRLHCRGEIAVHNLGLQMSIEKPLEQIKIIRDEASEAKEPVLTRAEIKN